MNTVKEIVILGAGGYAKEIAFLIEEINRAQTEPLRNILGFVDKDGATAGCMNGKYRVLGGEEFLQAAGRNLDVVMGIGWPGVVRGISARLGGLAHIHFPNLRHPSLVFDIDGVSWGRGNVVCAGNVFTTDIEIGSFNTFNLCVTLGHDVTVGNCCVINPGVNISGGVTIGDGCLIGTGATILQNITIGEGAIIGAGAVVTRDVVKGATVAGVPARQLHGR